MGLLDKAIGAIVEKADKTVGIDDMALIFSTIENHNINIQANITDYWLEDQTAVQESIGLQPLQISLGGVVADIEYNNKSLWGDNLLSKVNNLASEKLGFTLTNKLGAIGSLIPEVDNYTQQAKDALKQIETAYDKIKGKISKFVGSKTKTNQQKQVEWILKAWQAKTALKVTTPFGVFPNMYILSAPVVQENTNTVTKIQVTLKQLRFANETNMAITDSSNVVKEEINNVCSSDKMNNGVMKTEEMTTTDYISSFIGNVAGTGLSL